jgi:hypothetical protein
MYDLLAPDEVDFIDELGLKLNGAIEGAVRTVRDEGAPVFFVPNTEMAFQPDHTVCSQGSYARTIASFNGAGKEPKAVSGSDSGFWNRIGRLNPVRVVEEKLGEAGAALKQFQRGAQELLHPNQAGYAAVTRALLRWSQSPDAMAALEYLKNAPAAKPFTVTIKSSGNDLGQLVGGPTPTLQGGTIYPLNLQGFAPDTTVSIAVHSDLQMLSYVSADASGTLSTRVGIPADLEPGDHTLIVAGAGADGQPRTVEIPFQVAGGGLPTAVVAMIWVGVAGAVLTALLAAILVLGGRRRARVASR